MSWLVLVGLGPIIVGELVVEVVVVVVVVVVVDEVVVVVACLEEKTKYPTKAEKTRKQRTTTDASLLIAGRSWCLPDLMHLQT